MHSELLRKDLLYVWHPYTNQSTAPLPVPVTRGKDALFFDQHGNSYIDAISSWWVTIHGHGNAYIAEKLYKQALELEQVIFAGFTHRPAVELAERLVGVLPGRMEKIFYSDNGSTAVEVALKMAVQYWKNQEESESAKEEGGSVKEEVRREQPGAGSRESAVRGRETGVSGGLWGGPEKKRHKILALKNSYHGDTFGAMSVSERGIFTLAFQDYLFEVTFIDTPSSDNIHQTVHYVEQSGEEFACFIYEPLVQGAGGMIMYEPEMLDRLLESMKRKQILCIADEVMTGFYRTGEFFASNYMQNKPDIICLSKGLTGGTMAMGVTACGSEIFEVFQGNDRMKTFFHGHSFTANPIACAASLASLDLLQNEKTIENIRRICSSHERFLSQLKSSEALRKGRISNPRQRGTILAFEISDPSGNYLNPIGRRITEKAMAEGVFLRPLGNVVYLLPPYCITDDELQKVYAFLNRVIEEI